MPDYEVSEANCDSYTVFRLGGVRSWDCCGRFLETIYYRGRIADNGDYRKDIASGVFPRKRWSPVCRNTFNSQTFHALGVCTDGVFYVFFPYLFSPFLVTVFNSNPTGKRKNFDTPDFHIVFLSSAIFRRNGSKLSAQRSPCGVVCTRVHWTAVCVQYKSVYFFFIEFISRTFAADTANDEPWPTLVDEWETIRNAVRRCFLTLRRCLDIFSANSSGRRLP